jgi:ribonuclease-3
MSSVRHTPPLSSPTSPSNAVDGLPPLPEIRSEQIRKRIFTHSSSLAKGQKHAFQAPEDDLPVDNEE